MPPDREIPTPSPNAVVGGATVMVQAGAEANERAGAVAVAVEGEPVDSRAEQPASVAPEVEAAPVDAIEEISAEMEDDAEMELDLAGVVEARRRPIPPSSPPRPPPHPPSHSAEPAAVAAPEPAAPAVTSSLADTPNKIAAAVAATPIADAFKALLSEGAGDRIALYEKELAR